MVRIASICCECFLAYAEPEKTFLGADTLIDRCRCGGLLIKPEIDMAPNLHYAATMKASQTFDQKMLGVKH